MLDVLLVGNPNSGKTTLFNALTKSNEHIGNWHGVTVENKEKIFVFGAEEIRLIDTPGIYSLCPLSFEEKVAVEKIESGAYDKIINLCDQNNLQRNLYLTLCLIEKGCDVVLAINEMDKKPIFKVDCKKLSEQLGINVVSINAEKRINLEELNKCLTKTCNAHKLPYLSKLSGDFGQFSGENDYFKIKAYEKDSTFFEKHNLDVQKIFASVPKDSMQMLSKWRYDFVSQLLSTCAKRTNQTYGKSKFDTVALNKWLAFPIFFLLLAGIFYLTFFSLGAFLSNLLGDLLQVLTKPMLTFLEKSFSSSWIFDLFNVAIFGGVGTVLSFLPQIVLLFLFLSILEDSGYMSRIAFLFEDIFGKIGLSGKSIYTLLMGFGCSTTAIMTARNMDDKNAKRKTAILCPYMSCSAKIPIYTVIGGAFFGANNIFCIMGLYVLGVIVAIIISKILDKTVLKSQTQTFILEFPPYRMTSPKRIGKILWQNVKIFLTKVGSVMICMNIIVWILSSFSFSFSYVQNEGGTSMLETIGKIFSPIFAPIGLDNWAIVAALLSGLVAKEVVVSSIALFNGIDASATKLISQSVLLPTSLVYFASKASVLSFLTFCLLYTPCIASVSMLLQEIGKKWTAICIAIQLLTAYIVAFVVYNITLAFEVFGFGSVCVALFTLCVVVVAILTIIRKTRKGKCCANCSTCGAKCKK